MTERTLPAEEMTNEHFTQRSRRLIQEVKTALGVPDGVTYPSMNSARRIRELIKRLMEALVETERERRRLAVLAWKRLPGNHDREPPESLI
jgi:hypothetical protein